MKEVIKERQGLYRQEFEHDNCGIGAVVNIKGKKFLIPIISIGNYLFIRR